MSFTELDVEINIYLVQDVAHIESLCICKHHEFDVGRRLVVVQLILACPV
jgi:hypothetical protein